MRIAASTDEDADTLADSRDWQVVLETLRANPRGVFHGGGVVTDDMLRDLASIEGLEALYLGGCKSLTDDGARHLRSMRALRTLDLSGTAITDAAMSSLSQLEQLESLSLAMTRVTDDGIQLLAQLEKLRDVNLAWTRTGDRALAALAGKEHLTRLHSGGLLTDAGVAHLHNYPALKQWQGGYGRIQRMEDGNLPNAITLRGEITDTGIAHLRGLEGLYSLNVDDSSLPLTATTLAHLKSLPHLESLWVDAKDDWMPHLAELPVLRFLSVQDTTAGDDGFEALSRSKTIERIWGRRTHNLRDRGYVALARMPKLRSLSLSALNVSDDAVSTLPEFPALRELMPMDIPDSGYRHIGQCVNLERLTLMYCRDTTDAATEHITSLRKLTHYFNSYTTITDRTPELLSTIDSLERVVFDVCHNLTDAGIAKLARLPRLREVRVSGRRVTPAARTAFSSAVRVRVSF